ncbi:hypothetical protein STEG23_009536 [Scotinomys teguina]
MLYCKHGHLPMTVDLSLKSNLFDIRIATPACFLSPFDWKAFSQPFTLSSLKEFFISLRASITFCKSFLVMNSASSALVICNWAQCQPLSPNDQDCSGFTAETPSMIAEIKGDLQLGLVAASGRINNDIFKTGVTNVEIANSSFEARILIGLINKNLEQIPG